MRHAPWHDDTYSDTVSGSAALAAAGAFCRCPQPREPRATVGPPGRYDCSSSVRRVCRHDVAQPLTRQHQYGAVPGVLVVGARNVRGEGSPQFGSNRQGMGNPRVEVGRAASRGRPENLSEQFASEAESQLLSCPRSP